ncbi:MAG: winged helix-turn-helix domain-containing protein, partial [Acidobacteriota bacterium]
MQKRDALRIGDYDVEPSLNQVIRGPQVLPVEPRVMDLLVLLAESPGRVFGRDEILERVWPDTTVQDDALRRVVALLRRTLDDDPKSPRYIETITRRGYRLVAPVSHPEPEPGPPPVNEPPRWLWAAIALAGLAALAVAVWLFPRGDAPGGPGAELSLRPLTSLPGNESEPTFSADGERVAFIHR